MANTGLELHLDDDKLLVICIYHDVNDLSFHNEYEVQRIIVSNLPTLDAISKHLNRLYLMFEFLGF